MKQLLLTCLVFLSVNQLFAQSRVKVFLGNRKVDPMTVFFLDPHKVDSVKYYPGSQAPQIPGIKIAETDSVFVVKLNDRSTLINYDKLLERYHIDTAAKKLPARLLWGGRGIKDKDLMLFDADLVHSVSIKFESPNTASGLHVLVYEPADHGMSGPLYWLHGAVMGRGDTSPYKYHKP